MCKKKKKKKKKADKVQTTILREKKQWSVKLSILWYIISVDLLSLLWEHLIAQPRPIHVLCRHFRVCHMNHLNAAPPCGPISRRYHPFVLRMDNGSTAQWMQSTRCGLRVLRKICSMSTRTTPQDLYPTLFGCGLIAGCGSAAHWKGTWRLLSNTWWSKPLDALVSTLLLTALCLWWDLPPLWCQGASVKRSSLVLQLVHLFNLCTPLLCLIFVQYKNNTRATFPQISPCGSYLWCSRQGISCFPCPYHPTIMLPTIWCGSSTTIITNTIIMINNNTNNDCSPLPHLHYCSYSQAVLPLLCSTLWWNFSRGQTQCLRTTQPLLVLPPPPLSVSTSCLSPRGAPCAVWCGCIWPISLLVPRGSPPSGNTLYHISSNDCFLPVIV